MYILNFSTSFSSIVNQQESEKSVHVPKRILSYLELAHPILGESRVTVLHSQSDCMPKTAVTQVSRGLLWLSTVTVILIATLLAKKLEYIFVFKRSKVTPGADAVTSGLDLPTERSFPTTYLRSTVSQSYSRPITPQSQRSPDVTAVILNWSRLPNVIRIVSELCGAQLEDTISEVVVWNNNPKKLSQNVRTLFHILLALDQTKPTEAYNV